jgi:signal peptidase
VKRKSLTLAIVVGLFGAWLFLLGPSALGGPANYTIVNGESMAPTLQDGDLIVTKERDGYEVGDVVTYVVAEGEPGAGATVVHRLTGGEGGNGFTTQGDNNDWEDTWTPTADDITGELWIHIPRAGDVFEFLRSPAMVAALAGGLTTFFIITSDSSRPKAHRGPERRVLTDDRA